MDESLTSTRTDPKCVRKWAKYEVLSRCLVLSFHFKSHFRLHGVHSTCRNPLWTKHQHRVGQIRDTCQNEVGRMWTPCGVFSSGFVCASSVCMVFTLHVGTHRGRKFDTDSDGFEMHAEMRHIWSPCGVFVTQFPYKSHFCTYEVCGIRSNPLWMKFSHRLERIRNACQNELWCKRSPLEVFGTQVQFVPGFRMDGVYSAH